MKERGLTFCQELVPKVLDGSKFITRRLGGLKEINENPDNWLAPGDGPTDLGIWVFRQRDTGNPLYIKCRQGVAGDRFYMQEAWGLVRPLAWGHIPMNSDAAEIKRWREAGKGLKGADLVPVYKIDRAPERKGYKVRWRSGRFQYKWACRPQRWELISIRPERLREITDADILAEGFTHRDLFFFAWDMLNGKRGWPAEKNPWIWREEWNPKPVVGSV